MTSPVERVRVVCPSCGVEFDDWFRPSVNTGIEPVDETYLRAASTATCPRCGHVVELDVLIVEVER